MIYELKDSEKGKAIFEGWQETMIYSCLQKVMGHIYVTDFENPKSAVAIVGCFAFYAGKTNRELIQKKPEGFAILVPQNGEREELIEKSFPKGKKVNRYAIKKNTRFDKKTLERNIEQLPKGYELAKIDSDLYDKCLTNPIAVDFVSSFENKEQYLKIGRGMVVIKEGEIVSGASSYTRYNDGIEIEVDTAEEERRKHLALIACSALIRNCLAEGLYPSWDAQNTDSVRLAEKLGYEFDHEYIAYEIA